MKRILPVILCLALLLCGCGGKNETPAGDPANPLSAALAEQETTVDFAYIPETAEDACYVLLTANDNLTDVRLNALDGTSIGVQLCGFEAVAVGQTILAPLEFTEDMSAYCVSFTDSNGAYRCYALSLDGSPVLREFVP